MDEREMKALNDATHDLEIDRDEYEEYCEGRERANLPYVPYETWKQRFKR